MPSRRRWMATPAGDASRSWRGCPEALSRPPIPAQVAEILQGLFLKLPCIIFKNILQTMMKAVTMLGTQHTQETVEVLLSLCHPSER